MTGFVPEESMFGNMCMTAGFQEMCRSERTSTNCEAGFETNSFGFQLSHGR